MNGGRRLAFTLMTNQGNKTRSKAAEVIQKNLKAVGIDVSIRIVEWAAFLKEFVNPKKFDAVILGWTIPRDPDSYDVWHSSKTGPAELNHVSFKNAEADTLIEKGRRTFDQEERRKAYARFQEILAEEQPYVFLYVPDALPIVSARIRGIVPAPAGISYNFIKWWVPKIEQKYTR
jgi:peptide/nickel transport system substrate-binding protein